MVLLWKMRVSISNVGIVLTWRKCSHTILHWTHDFWLKTRVRQAEIWGLFWDLTIRTCFFFVFRLVRNFALVCMSTKPITTFIYIDIPSNINLFKNVTVCIIWKHTRAFKPHGFHPYGFPLRPCIIGLYGFLFVSSTSSCEDFHLQASWVKRQRNFGSARGCGFLGESAVFCRSWCVFVGVFLVIFCSLGIRFGRWFKFKQVFFFVTRVFSCFFFAGLLLFQELPSFLHDICWSNPRFCDSWSIDLLLKIHSEKTIEPDYLQQEFLSNVSMFKHLCYTIIG